jgi:hypothetical protein
MVGGRMHVASRLLALTYLQRLAENIEWAGKRSIPEKMMKSLKHPLYSSSSDA